MVPRTVLPLTNSMIPERNWQTPPKKIKTPIKTLGVATPRTCTPKMEMRKIPGNCQDGTTSFRTKFLLPVAKDSNPSGAGLAKLRCTTGRDG